MSSSHLQTVGSQTHARVCKCGTCVCVMVAMKSSKVKAKPSKKTTRSTRKAKVMKTTKQVKKKVNRIQSMAHGMPQRVKKVDHAIWRRMGPAVVEMAWEHASKFPQSKPPSYLTLYEWRTLVHFNR